LPFGDSKDTNETIKWKLNAYSKLLVTLCP